MNPRGIRYAFYVLCILVVACSRSAPPKPAPPQPANPLTINLVPPYAPPVYKYEIIISTPDAAILLDTITTSGAPIQKTLNTSDTIVDVSTVIWDSTGHYVVVAYRSVDPRKWTYVFNSTYALQFNLANYSRAQEYFTHVPPPTAPWTGYSAQENFCFNNFVYPGSFAYAYNDTTNTMLAPYAKYPNAYSYVLFTATGLYRLFKPASASDTIDLSHLDTAIELTMNQTTPFTISPGYGIFPTQLIGLVDSTDLSSAILLSTLQKMLPHADFAIPKTPMQIYELQLSAGNSVRDQVYFYSYGPTVPTTPVFPDPNSFNIVSKQSDNFTVSWTGQHPSYYTTQWANNTVILQLYAPPDSTTQHPNSFLTSLKSRLLQGVSLSGMNPQEFQIETAPGFDYRSFMTYTSDSLLFQKHTLRTSSWLLRIIQ